LKIRRRGLLKNLVLASGAAAFAPSWPFGKMASAGAVLPDLPSPGNSGIDHVVVVNMENRSFDHLLGWLWNAHGKQAGLTYVGQARNRAPKLLIVRRL
jgi:phospholipase C